MQHTTDNPFWVWTPEDIGAEQATQLFVHMFSDFPAIESPSHTFIRGPRGSGKSMMFRMMRPDCAMLAQECDLADLKYLGIYIPIKRTEITQTELAFLDSHPGRYVFSEHLLCLYFSIMLFDELASPRITYKIPVSNDQFDDWIRKKVAAKLAYAEPISFTAPEAGVDEHAKKRFATVRDALQADWTTAETLVRALPLNPNSLSTYSGPLLSYHGFLLPLVEGLKELPCFPRQPIYLLIDDADNLSRTQTEILNSWIATRTTGKACIKASTQMRYKTRLTPGGERVEAPHDYNEVDVSVLYTTRREYYLDRLGLIVKKRLSAAGLADDPNLFFPEDLEQKKSIRTLEENLKKRHLDGEGRGNRPRDDANRYARPEFIRQLGGDRKSTSKYSYSGFPQLAHISSGVVRWFLEPAARMYSDEQSRSAPGSAPITHIDPAVQDRQARKFSEEFFVSEFEQLTKEAAEQVLNKALQPERETDYRKLECLVDAMGRTFAHILRDEARSERRVFSIALSDRVEADVQRVLDLGVQEGYLYRTTIGKKSGYGRTARYVLSRRLAPYFSLDPTSFSGYLFVTNENLRRAMNNPKAVLREHVLDEDVQMELPIGNAR